MKPRTNGGHKRGPLNTMPNPRLSREQVAIRKAAAYHEERKGKTQRELLIEAGIITPRKRR